MEDQTILIKILVAAYGVTGIFALVGYWPTIKDLYYQKEKSANVTSYALWSLTGGIAFLYSIFVIQDTLLRIINGLNFGACLVIFILSILFKNKRS